MKMVIAATCMLVLVCSVAAHPAPAQVKYDFVVAKDGSGNFLTLQEAVNACRDYAERDYLIFVKNGLYEKKLVIPSWKKRLVIIGENVDKTIITFNDFSGKADSSGKKHSTFTSHTCLVAGNDTFYCENGSYTVYDRTIRDHSSKHGWLTFQQVIKVSSNIGAAKAAEKMGKDRFYRYLCNFGFGEKTGVGLPGEAKGIFHHPRYWVPDTLDTIAIGQGVAVTGIQMATALSAIVNGGTLMKPHVVEKITNEKEVEIQSFKPDSVRRVISEETSRAVMALLKATTEKGGTGEQAVPLGYEVGGKTGTAQKADSILGGYSEDKFISGFRGFAPAEEPKIVVLVVIDEPQGSTYGGVVAAPVFRTIVETRVEQALEKKPDAIATACPYCLTMFEDGLKSKNAFDTVKALDIAEYIANAMKE